MDKASLVGVIVGSLCLGFTLVEASQGRLAMFYSQEGLIMVFGGTISVVFMAMPMSSLSCVGGWIKRFLFHKGRSPVETVKLMSELADKARREGILALESDIDKIKESDPFLASGLRMTIDGMDPANIEATLRMEILSMQERHKAGKKFFDLIKLYGPGWALSATLLGQVAMFGNLASADIGTLGKNLAIAVCATFYGTVLANGAAGPIGDKLGMRSGEEILTREMILQGVLSVQAGDNPRLTLDKMTAFIPVAVRQQLKAAA